MLQPTEIVMINSSILLRGALLADAIASGALALLLTIAAAPLASLLALPDALLHETGLLLIPYALFVGYLGSRVRLPVTLAWLIVAGNVVYALASFALLLGNWLSPNLLGELFIAAQAIAVGVLAELQYIGTRRSASALAVA
jgi:hypothetical protein